MTTSVHDHQPYRLWLTEIKQKIQRSQIKAAVKVNTELLLLYWELGTEIIAKQQHASWGDGLIPQLSKDLSSAFPGMKGFSRTNLFYIRQWVLFYSQPIVPQLVGQLDNRTTPDHQPPERVRKLVTQIPWGHNRVIIDKCETIEQAIFYIQQ